MLTSESYTNGKATIFKQTLTTMKTLFIAIFLAAILTSCADSKEFKINGENVTVEPYGWFDSTQANDSINYRVCSGNVVWSIILSETVVVPVLLTGNSLWEPVSKK